MGFPTDCSVDPQDKQFNCSMIEPYFEYLRSFFDMDNDGALSSDELGVGLGDKYLDEMFKFFDINNVTCDAIDSFCFQLTIMKKYQPGITGIS